MVQTYNRILLSKKNVLELLIYITIIDLFQSCYGSTTYKKLYTVRPRSYEILEKAKLVTQSRSALAWALEGSVGTDCKGTGRNVSE